MSSALLILAALGLGFLTGLRAFTPIALICWLAVWGWIPLAGSVVSFLGTTVGAVVASILALAELVRDKLPQTPSRTAPGPLGGRILNGALCGLAISLAGGQAWIGGIAGGALGAVAGTFVGYKARRALVRAGNLPDLVIALVEDFIAIAGTLFLLARLFSRPV